MLVDDPLRLVVGPHAGLRVPGSGHHALGLFPRLGEVVIGGTLEVRVHLDGVHAFALIVGAGSGRVSAPSPIPWSHPADGGYPRDMRDSETDDLREEQARREEAERRLAEETG